MKSAPQSFYDKLLYTEPSVFLSTPPGLVASPPHILENCAQDFEVVAPRKNIFIVPSVATWSWRASVFPTRLANSELEQCIYFLPHRRVVYQFRRLRKFGVSSLDYDNSSGTSSSDSEASTFQQTLAVLLVIIRKHGPISCNELVSRAHASRHKVCKQSFFSFACEDVISSFATSKHVHETSGTYSLAFRK